eukprot:CAMPEP_0180528068 /NCGR_PEP_ID=MMETSP1036_2-20121128/60581_1 /TAXON_ID=632150 /ORGANISM="Azadinium spinosum, Strain 3D9" /LENGTH=290 /DNA_ID=CAMNT_0022541563 /DNA_START=397 /DNA_END=1266 /DNA_ORIENTATION=+
MTLACTYGGCNCKTCFDTSTRDLFQVGRLYTTGAGVLTARIAASSRDSNSSGGPSDECDWSRWFVDASHEEAVPIATSKEGLGTQIAEHYQSTGLGEHASVASFSRVLELMRHGAPAQLVDRTLSAAREEVQHAQMALSLARAWSTTRFRVTGIDGLLAERGVDGLADLAALTATEAVAGETPGVLRAAIALRFTRHQQVREYLSRVVVEERRHAELAWATVAWALLAEAENGGTSSPQAQGATRLATARALGSAISSLWEQANKSVPVSLERNRAAILLQVGMLSPDLE